MGIATSLLFVFVAGLTLSGLSSTLLQIITGAQLGFSPPFVHRQRLAASLAMTVVAGPFMLLNDALMARKFGRIGDGALIGVCAIGAIWLLSLGVLLVELVLFVSSL